MRMLSLDMGEKIRYNKSYYTKSEKGILLEKVRNTRFFCLDS